MKKAEATRKTILYKAFDLIYANGYHATSIDDIIAQTNVTKGAFFYHFKSKEEMGLAVINEVMYDTMYADMLDTIVSSADPVKDLYKLFENLLLLNPMLQITYGCPANNLMQELASINNAFNIALTRLVNEWEKAIAVCINNGKKAGKISKDVNPKQVAYFIMSGYGGIRNIGKVYQTKDTYKVYLKELKRYLKSLE